MIALNLPEAQLFRLAGAFFGKDRIVMRMSVLAVCGGTLPAQLGDLGLNAEQWAKQNTCLLTVVDHDDNPRMVIEFFSGFEKCVDLKEAEHQRYLRPILQAAGVTYLTISDVEFDEILNPSGKLDFFHLLRAKFLEYGGVESP